MGMLMENDSAESDRLLERARAGDAAPLEEIFTHYRGRFRLSLRTASPLRLIAAGRVGAASLDSLDGYTHLAAVLLGTGRQATVAARVFGKALESEETPEKLQAIRQAAVHDDAVFLELSKVRPRDAERWTARGRHLAETGKQKEAEEAFAQAAKLKPN
jgi:hypothetical protein